MKQQKPINNKTKTCFRTKSNRIKMKFQRIFSNPQITKFNYNIKKKKTTT